MSFGSLQSCRNIREALRSVVAKQQKKQTPDNKTNTLRRGAGFNLSLQLPNGSQKLLVRALKLLLDARDRATGS